jgi:spore coat polysaccharide biosynthesis predicted glycosyltransferase SpsG
MNRDPILFRVDGTPRLGWEHVARCQTLAAALQRRRRPTYFLSQLEPGSLALPLKRAGNEWLDADAQAGTPEDLQEMIQEVRRLQPAAVIVDGPEVPEQYLNELRAAGPLLVSLDSQATIRLPSRLVINPLLGPGREAYHFADNTQILAGPRYALVRSDIRRVRPLRSVEPPQPFRGLVMLGDDDPNNQSAELAKLLLNTPKVQRVDIVARPQHPALENMRALGESRAERLEIAVEPAEVVARISRCHFAITAGNAASLDLACVGVPQLVIVQNEVHWPTAQRLEEEGAAICLGWHANVSPQTIRQTVQDLLDDQQERQAMTRCGRQLIDGRGQDRLVTALEILLHPSRQVSFSEAA